MLKMESSVLPFGWLAQKTELLLSLCLVSAGTINMKASHLSCRMFFIQPFRGNKEAIRYPGCKELGKCACGSIGVFTTECPRDKETELSSQEETEVSGQALCIWHKNDRSPTGCVPWKSKAGAG